MSHEVFIPNIQSLGDAHYGRKDVQPPRNEVREFSRDAEAKLAHSVLWWDNAERQALTKAFGDIVRECSLTCYTCAVLSNHVHLLIRKHRRKAEEMIGLLKNAGREILRETELVPEEHPVFSADRCRIYKDNVASMRNCIRYIERNFEKHRIPKIECDFLTPYNNWPFHKKHKKHNKK